MPKEILLQDECDRKAKLVGDSLPKLMKAMDDEFREIKFKGIEFIKMTVSFHVSPGSIDRPTMTISIWCSALDSNEQLNVDLTKDSRTWSVPYRADDLASIFWLIHFWKRKIIENHAAKIKALPPKTLFDK